MDEQGQSAAAGALTRVAEEMIGLRQGEAQRRATADQRAASAAPAAAPSEPEDDIPF